MKGIYDDNLRSMPLRGEAFLYKSTDGTMYIYRRESGASQGQFGKKPSHANWSDVRVLTYSLGHRLSAISSAINVERGGVVPVKITQSACEKSA